MYARGLELGRNIDFVVDQIDAVTMTGNLVVSRRDLMSPYVWQPAPGEFAMLVRAVPHPDECGDSGTIWYAASRNGLAFVASDHPVLSPGPKAEDIGGCEDPTPVIAPDGSVVVYYTGVDATRTHGEMLYACGPSIDQLRSAGLRCRAPLRRAISRKLRSIGRRTAAGGCSMNMPATKPR